MFVEKMIEWIEENYEIDEPEKELLAIYKDSRCCVPEDCIFWNDEDTYNAIDLKFYLIFRAIADTIQGDYSGNISVVISPSYDDATGILMIWKDRVIWEDWIKAWNFHFASLDELEEYCREVYDEASEKLAKIRKNNQDKVIKQLRDLVKYAVAELKEWNPESEAAIEIENSLAEILAGNEKGEKVKIQCSQCGKSYWIDSENIEDLQGCPFCDVDLVAKL